MTEGMRARGVLAAAAMTVGAIAATMAASPARAADDPVFGYWLTQNKLAIVQIGPCDSAPDKACGKFVWLQKPVDDAGKPRTDLENPDESLRSRPLCGLPLVGDFKKTAEGEWEDGYIYDSQHGDTYTAYMEAQSDGTLKVRGYIGLPILGKSQIWTREDGDRGGCAG